jgi:hypothetical protein
MVIRKRYSEFVKLREHLKRTFPKAGAALPELPRKGFMHRFQPKFLEQRKEGLAYFLKSVLLGLERLRYQLIRDNSCVLLNPEFASSPVMKDFLFGRL